MITGISVAALLAVLAVFVGETSPRRGFLPWTTTWGDRFFVSLLVLFLISLLWLRFVVPALPMYFAVIISLIAGFVIIKWG
jgi:predicted small integral membrane protein